MPKKQKERKGKKEKKKNTKQPKSALYETKGESVERKRRNCPKCGPGVMMAEHRDRVHCGKCGYTEFKQRKGE